MSHVEVEERVTESYKEAFGHAPSVKKLHDLVEEVEWHLSETLTHAIAHVLLEEEKRNDR